MMTPLFLRVCGPLNFVFHYSKKRKAVRMPKFSESFSDAGIDRESQESGKKHN